MALSNDLLSQFAQITSSEEQSTEKTVYGTIVESDGKKYVRLDGSNIDTPISTTTDAAHGDRVTVMIKNHSAVVTGNISSPSARKVAVDELDDKVAAVNTVLADTVDTKKLLAESARIEQLIVTGDAEIRGELDAESADIRKLVAEKATIKELEAVDAKFDNLDSKYASIDVLESGYVKTDDLKATDATVHNLSVDYAEFKEATTDKLEANDAVIENLDSNYANIDFANIGEAALKKIYSDNGIIKDIIIKEGKVTGELVGVTIKGDLIEGNTIKADKLVVKGSDGIYYKLNFESGNFTDAEEVPADSIHGSVIAANSITAEKVSVSDLVAFDATIGGFNITDDSLYSGVKSSVDNTTTGIFMDSNGQMAIGDASNYLKFYKDGNSYKLDISASNIRFASRTKSIEEEFNALDDRFADAAEYTDGKFNAAQENIDKSNDRISGIEKYVVINEDGTGITIGSNDSRIVLKLDNTKGIEFYKKGSDIPFGKWDGEYFHTGNIMIETNQRAQFGDFAFVPRSNGSLSFLKVRSGKLNAPVISLVNET